MPDLVLGIGAGAHGADAVIDLGTLSPASHGALRLQVTVDGDGGPDSVVTGADPQVGLLHRGAEKLFEARDYRQIIMLANRHDWLSAFSSELGVALAVERLMGIEVPERATWGRTLLAELNRVAASLAHLDLVGSAPAREAVLDHLAVATGGRIHHMMTRIGGLARPLTSEWLAGLERVCDQVEGARSSLDAAIAGTPDGVAVLTREDALSFGTSGAVARASGLDIDLRRDDPYLAYGQLRDLLPSGAGPARGDARSRREHLAAGIAVSLAIVRRCAERLLSLGEGPHDVPLPKVVRAPEGAAYAWTENPSGINGYYIVSTAEKSPWRCKLRSASFNNVQALSAALPGTRVADLGAALASFFFVVGDIDR